MSRERRWNTNFQSVLLIGHHRIAQICPLFLHTWFLLDLKVLLLERESVAEEELSCLFEHVWDNIMGEIPIGGARDISEHDANVVG